MALNALHADPSTTVLIGDHTSDVEAAQRAFTMSIGYANKQGKSFRLKAAGADAIITAMTELTRSLI